MPSKEKHGHAAKASVPRQTQSFKLAGATIAPGQRRTVDLPISVLSNHTPVTLPIHVVHGRRAGPTVFVSAAVHGDEIIGVEIVRRLLRTPALNNLSGTLLMIPIVNSFGFISHSRYLPDRRDLNRSFPGSANGSLAAQLAHLFFTHVVERSNFGIDLHSAAVNRSNLPQIRADVTDEKALALAESFGAPIILHSSLREGSMREAAAREGVPVVVYECGEGLRFDELSIRIGVKGVLRALGHLGMIAHRREKKARAPSPVSKRSTWVRAPQGGILRALKTLGDSVQGDELIGYISDPFGEDEAEVRAMDDGLIVGRANLPVVNQGDPLFHVASLARVKAVESALGSLEEDMRADPLFDEDEIM